jgi:FAD/FMN-containing dehydrogenase
VRPQEPKLGSWAKHVGGVLWAEPRDERELIEVLHVLADRGASLNRELKLSLARLVEFGPLEARSMTCTAGAGVRLVDLEAHVGTLGLTLGPMPPGALGLGLGEFLQGPYAGLRAVAGGRLEPLCSGLTVVTAEGRTFHTSGAPRSAMGPDLTALVLGAHGRLGLVSRATVRCLAAPELQAALCFEFPSAQSLVATAMQSLADGLVPSKVRLAVREGRVAGAFHWSGSRGSTQRDRERLLRCAMEHGAHARSDIDPDVATNAEERESTWDQVRRALDQGKGLVLTRLSLATVVACGEVEGMSLDTATPWHPDALRLLSLDPHHTLGGAP